MFVVRDAIGNLIACNPIAQNVANEMYVADTDPIIIPITQSLTEVKYVSGQLVYRPRASQYQYWDGNQWVADSTVLADARAAIWEKIKDYRQLRQWLGVKINISGTDWWIHSDAPSRELHLGLRADAVCHLARTRLLWMEFPAFENVAWKTMQKYPNGQPVFITVTWQVALDIYAADRAMTAACFAKAEYHRLMMEASADPTNYDYTTGWPQVYGE